MSQQDQHATKLNHAEEVIAVTFPTDQQAAEVLQPCEQPLDFPAAFKAAKFTKLGFTRAKTDRVRPFQFPAI